MITIVGDPSYPARGRKAKRQRQPGRNLIGWLLFFLVADWCNQLIRNLFPPVVTRQREHQSGTNLIGWFLFIACTWLVQSMRDYITPAAIKQRQRPTGRKTAYDCKNTLTSLLIIAEIYCCRSLYILAEICVCTAVTVIPRCYVNAFLS